MIASTRLLKIILLYPRAVLQFALCSSQFLVVYDLETIAVDFIVVSITT